MAYEREYSDEELYGDVYEEEYNDDDDMCFAMNMAEADELNRGLRLHR